MPKYRVEVEWDTTASLVIEAPTLQLARERAVILAETGKGDWEVGYDQNAENFRADDNIEVIESPDARDEQHAQANTEAWEEWCEENPDEAQDEGAFDNNVCPSAPRPLTEGETAHKWDTDTDPVSCAECGATYDPEIHTVRETAD